MDEHHDHARADDEARRAAQGQQHGGRQEPGPAEAAGWIRWILDAAIDGVGPMEDAITTSRARLQATGGDPELAIRQLTTSEMRTLGVTGFVSGFGGFPTMPVALPADLTIYHLRAARLAACVAHLRGYDLTSPVIRLLVALTLAGQEGRRLAQRQGIELGSFEAIGRLHDLPASLLQELEQAVGIRLITNAGVKGAINVARFVPVIGGVAAGAVNVMGLRDIATAATSNFPRAVA